MEPSPGPAWKNGLPKWIANRRTGVFRTGRRVNRGRIPHNAIADRRNETNACTKVVTEIQRHSQGFRPGEAVSEGNGTTGEIAGWV